LKLHPSLDKATPSNFERDAIFDLRFENHATWVMMQIHSSGLEPTAELLKMNINSSQHLVRIDQVSPRKSLLRVCEKEARQKPLLLRNGSKE